MQSGASTPRAIGRLSRSFCSCSVTSGLPRKKRFSAVAARLGVLDREVPGDRRAMARAVARRARPPPRRPRRPQPTAPTIRTTARPLSLQRTPRRGDIRRARRRRRMRPGRLGRRHAAGARRATPSRSSTGPSGPSTVSRPDFNGTTVVGSGFDREALDAAGARGAGALAAVTSGDNSNILCARIARENYGIANVVARIYDPRRAVIYQRLGIPTVATVTWTTTQVLRWLSPSDDTVEWRDATGRAPARRADPAGPLGGAAPRRPRDAGPRQGGVDRAQQPAAAGRRRRSSARRTTWCSSSCCRDALRRARRAAGARPPDARRHRGRGQRRHRRSPRTSSTTATASRSSRQNPDARRGARDRTCPGVEVLAADACEVSSLQRAGLRDGRGRRGGDRRRRGQPRHQLARRSRSSPCRA